MWRYIRDWATVLTIMTSGKLAYSLSELLEQKTDRRFEPYKSRRPATNVAKSVANMCMNVPRKDWNASNRFHDGQGYKQYTMVH